MSSSFRLWLWLVPTLLWLGTSWGIAQIPEEGTLLYIDGMNILARKSYPLHQDDLVRFEAYSLAPGTKLEFSARSKSQRIIEEDFTANSRGEVKTVLFFPRARGEILCQVTYTAPNGRLKKVRFFLEKYGRGRKDEGQITKTGGKQKSQYK